MQLHAVNSHPMHTSVADTTAARRELAQTDLTWLHRRALRLTHDHDAAQDLVQDTLERACRKLALYRPGSDMPAWLISIMRNIWISRYRRQVGAPAAVTLDEIELAASVPCRGSATDASDVEASVIDELGAASIRQAMERLPPQLRQVVVLADVEEIPYRIIASRLAIPLGTVSSRLSRGRERLRQQLLTQMSDGVDLAWAS